MSDIKCKLLVIGAGPGGYVCAIRAGQLGIDTVVLDPQAPGGTCLNVGCIPSKALIHVADEFHRMSHAREAAMGITCPPPSLDMSATMAWKDGIVGRLNGGVQGLLRKAGVRLIPAQGRFLDGKTVEAGGERIRAEVIVIATGSEPVALPGLPFGGDVLSSTGALSLTTLPESLAVVGGGYIGLELGTAFAKLGSRVSVVEAGPRLLPQYDNALTRPIAQRLSDLGVQVMLGAQAQRFENGVLYTDQGEVGAGKVLVTVGRRPRWAGMGLEDLSLTMDGAFVQVNEACQTSMRGIYAIGDVTGEPMLAHRAMAQGEMVAEHIAGRAVGWDKRCIPAVCFTDPEIVSCGAEPGAVAGSKVSEFPFQANGRAMTTGREDGFVRIVWREADQAVLGVQAVGEGISEMAATFAMAIEMGACLSDIAATIHAHPTRSEAFQEAALRALGQALHI